MKQGRRKSWLGERPWQTKRGSPSAKSEAPGIKGVNGKTPTPKSRVSSVHGDWATTDVVAAAAPDPAAVKVAVAPDHPAAAAAPAAGVPEVVVALSAAETRAPSDAAIALAAPSAVAEAHLVAAAAALVVAVVEVVAAAAAAADRERHVPAVVVAAQLHQGSRMSRGAGSYPGPRPQRPSDALRRAP